MPNGIFYANERGGIYGYTIGVQIEYLSNGTVWTAIGDKKLSYQLDFKLDDNVRYDDLGSERPRWRWIFTDPYSGEETIFR